MDFNSQNARSPKRCRLDTITNVGTPPNAVLPHFQLKRMRDGRFNPSPALTPDAKARRRKAIEAAMSQTVDENAFQSLECAATPSRSTSRLSIGFREPQKTDVESFIGTPSNTQSSSIPDVTEDVASAVTRLQPLLTEGDSKKISDGFELRLYPTVGPPHNPQTDENLAEVSQDDSQSIPDSIIVRHQKQHGADFVGFLRAHSGSSWVPSSQALLLAHKKLGEWEAELMNEDSSVSAKTSNRRSHIFESSEGASEQFVDTSDRLTHTEAFNGANKSTSTPTQRTADPSFGSPQSHNSDLRPSQAAGIQQKAIEISIGTQSPFRKPFRPPSRTISGLSRAVGSKHKFKTPFKADTGTAPSVSLTPLRSSILSQDTNFASKGNQARTRHTDQIMGGLQPLPNSAYSFGQQGTRIEELLRVNVQTAALIRFPVSPELQKRYPSLTTTWFSMREAYDLLVADGCQNITIQWVENAWGLILWKLAGMSLLHIGASRSDIDGWNASEILKQIQSRYEREFQNGQRSPFQYIETQDAPASYPMVLCVSDIVYSKTQPTGTVDDQSQIQLEVTDGWYRLRATVDPPLQRAVERKKLRVGMKISCFGIKFESTSKRPSGVLDAYRSTNLVLTGNSTHLASWHAKLGYRRNSYISSMRKLSPDGGLVPMIFVTVIKVLPLAFIETVLKGGQQQRLPPHNQTDEDLAARKWQNKRDQLLDRLQLEAESKINLLEDLAGQLRSLAQNSKHNSAEDSSESLDLEDLLERMENGKSTGLRALSAEALESLSEEVSQKIQALRETEMIIDLEELCPPRRVRSFRVIIAKDAFNNRRNSSPTAQITIWDAANEIDEYAFCVATTGRQPMFVLTNLQPTQARAWMNYNQPGAEIYLSTRRDSRLLPIKEFA